MWNTSTELEISFYDGAEFINGLSQVGVTFSPIFYEGSEDDTELNPWQFQAFEGSTMVWGIFTSPAGPIDPNPIVLFEGESAASTLIRFTYFYGTFVEGATNVITLTTRPVAYFTPSFYDGTEVDSNLSTTTDLTGDGPAVNYEGAEFDFIGLTTFPASPIIPLGSFLTFGDGSSEASSLQTSVAIPIVMGSGLPAWTSFDLTTCPGCNALEAIFYDGATIICDLETFEFFDIPMFDGSELDTVFSIRPFAALSSTLYDGTEADSSLSTTSDLTGDGPAVQYDGSQMNAALTLNLPWTSANPIFYDGSENDLLNLHTKVVITDWFYDGDEMDWSLTTNPQKQLAPIFYDGTAFIVPTIAAQQSLPVLIAYEGSIMVLPAVSNLANWYIYEGSNMPSPSLSTQMDLTADGDLINADGSYQFFELTISPAQPLANQWPIHDGTTMAASAISFPHATFSVVFMQDSYLQTDFSTSTHHIDLAKQCAIAQPDSYFYWKDPDVSWLNLTNGGVQAIPGALATGFSSYMNVTIAFHEHLQPMPMYEGSTFGIYDFWPLLDNVGMGSMGFGMAVLDLKFDLDIPLCYGNFIPDGNAVDAELSTIDDTSCSVDQAYDGSVMLIHMENNIQFAPRFAEGASSISTLTVPSAWVFQFYSGEHMFVASNVQFTFPMYQGEFLTVEFAPLTITFFSGDTFIAPAPNTNYTVQFMEVGCLPNEYTPTTIVDYNPFGPPPTANIELQPFYHQILAECF